MILVILNFESKTAIHTVGLLQRQSNTQIPTQQSKEKTLLATEFVNKSIYKNCCFFLPQFSNCVPKISKYKNAVSISAVICGSSITIIPLGSRLMPRTRTWHACMRTRPFQTMPIFHTLTPVSPHSEAVYVHVRCVVSKPCWRARQGVSYTRVLLEKKIGAIM